MGRCWTKRGGHEVAMRVIGMLAERGVFREKDLVAQQLSHNWLNIAEEQGLLRCHDHGVWSRRNYTPTRYELVQVRFPKAVFWGPTALWLHGAEKDEPETLWVALSNTSQVPKTLDPTTFAIRTRNLNADVSEVRQPKTFLKLRVHSVERARKDISRTDFHRVLERAANRNQFALPREASFLSSSPRKERLWHQIRAPPDEWVAK